MHAQAFMKYYRFPSYQDAVSAIYTFSDHVNPGGTTQDTQYDGAPDMRRSFWMVRLPAPTNAASTCWLYMHC